MCDTRLGSPVPNDTYQRRDLFRSRSPRPSECFAKREMFVLKRQFMTPFVPLRGPNRSRESLEGLPITSSISLSSTPTFTGLPLAYYQFAGQWADSVRDSHVNYAPFCVISKLIGMIKLSKTLLFTVLLWRMRSISLAPAVVGPKLGLNLTTHMWQLTGKLRGLMPN